MKEGMNQFLSVASSTDYLEKTNILNSIILGRSNMIIQYKKIQDFIPVESFLAYLMISKKQPESLKFFRTSEPPSHNEWKTTSDRLKDNYGVYAGPNALRKFNRTLEEIIQEEYGFKIDKDEDLERIKQHLKRFLPQSFEIGSIDRNEPRKVEIKKIEDKKEGKKGHRPGTKIGRKKTKTKPKGKGKGKNIDEPSETKRDEESDLAIADLTPDEDFQIIQELNIEFLQNRKNLDLNSLKKLDALITPMDSELKDFTHIYIEVEAERDDTSDWKKLDILYKDQYLPYYGLKLKQKPIISLFPLRVQVDLKSIPKYLRNKVFLIPRAYTCIVN
jgi:hypothetical protein